MRSIHALTASLLTDPRFSWQTVARSERASTYSQCDQHYKHAAGKQVHICGTSMCGGVVCMATRIGHRPRVTKAVWCIIRAHASTDLQVVKELWRAERKGMEGQGGQGGFVWTCRIITLSETATTARPVGRDRAFWEPVTAMSIFHLSIWKSRAPIEDTPSTMNRAGWPQASIVSLILERSLVTPVAVSLWTTAIALIFLSVSALSACRACSPCLTECLYSLLQ